MAALAIRRRANLRIDEGLFALLSRHLFTTALLEQEVAASLPLRPLTEYPGYLKGTINGSNVFVPWHLVEVFPALKVVASMEALSRKIQLNCEGPICLSGSSVFRGVVNAVGDIDYCEYLAAATPQEIPSFVNDLLGRNSGIYLARLYLPGTNPSIDCYPPWDRCPEGLSALCGDARDPTGAPIMMFEHLASDEVFGLLPVTNRVLPVDDEDAASGHGQTTFVFQEIVFVRRDAPPRTLVAPLEIADYVLWLRDQLPSENSPTLGKKLNTVKVLKRALSLARLMHFHDLGGEILIALNDPSVERYVRSASVAEVVALYGYLASSERRDLSSKLEALKETVDAPSRAECERIDAHALELAFRVGGEFDRLTEDVLQVEL